MKLGQVVAIALGLVFAGGPALAEKVADEQSGLRCRRLHRAVQAVIATEDYESARTGAVVRQARKPRRVVRELVGFSGRQRTVGRGCMRCISRQVKRGVSLAEQTACGLHDPCVVGQPLDRSMGGCVEAVCASDPSCCRSEWDAGCVEKVTSVCGETCEPCSHDVCEAGAALQPTCGTCAAAVCEVDPFCCDTLWSEDCAAKVPSVCKLSCAPPVPSTTTSTTSTTVAPLDSTTTTIDDQAENTASTTTTTVPLRAANDCVDLVDFADDPAGTLMSRALTSSGRPVVVRGTNPKLGNDVNAALVFDSTCGGGKRCSGGDSDLGAPNRDFGGPGEGVGGRRDQPYENSVPLGNILIIGEDLRDDDGDGLIDDPDDQAGVIVMQEFDFSAFAPATVYGLTVIDVERVEQPAKIEAFDAAGGSLGAFPIPATGDNGVATVDLGGVSGVWKLIVTFRGSSAIAGIALGCGDGGGTTTTTSTTTTSTSSTSSTTTTLLPIGESVSCPVTFSITNATTTFALQFEVDHTNAPGGFPNDPCSVAPEGFSDFNTDGDTLEIGWADSTGSGFAGPATFATCTFISTGGTPSREDLSVAILDCSGPNPPEPCDPAPIVRGEVGTCSPVTPVCGNAVLEQGEQCDDGNAIDGDGCSASCSTEGVSTTSTTTTSTTTTTAPTTSSTTTTESTTTTSTTTTLPPTTTTTTSSTTTTTLPQSFSLDCTLTFRVTSSELLGSLKYEVNYADAPGGFVGSGLGVSCTNLVTGASKSFFDDETNKILRESLISVSGFRGPLDIATCVFETNDDTLTAGAFGVTVVDATTPDLEIVSPAVAISAVQCAAKPALSGVARDFAPLPWAREPVGAVY